MRISRKRLEGTKTVLLTVLVLASVVLSGLLWNDAPASDPSQPTGSSLNLALGPDKQPKQVTMPSEVIVHEGEDKHLRFGPFTDSYQQALDLLNHITVTDWTAIDFNDQLWNRISNDKSISIHCPVLSAGDRADFALAITMPFNLQGNAWIHFYKEGSDLRVVAVSGSHAYGSKAIMPVDLQAFVDKWNKEPLKQPTWNQHGNRFSPFYLPDSGVQVAQGQFVRSVFPLDQLVNSYFVDPSLTRKITERTGTLIYTDGVRGVQIDPNTKRVTYTNSSLQGVGKMGDNSFTFDKGLKMSLDFTKDHGGLNGNYVVFSNDVNAAGESGKNQTAAFQFRKYQDGYPIFNELGSVVLRVQADGVEEMSQSMLYFGRTNDTKSNLTLLPGAKLLAQLSKRGLKEDEVQDVQLVWHPANEPARNANEVALYPVYEVQANGNTLLYDAVTGDNWTDTTGWLDGLE